MALFPAAAQLGSCGHRQPECTHWLNSIDALDSSKLCFEASWQHQHNKLDALYKVGGHQGPNSRLGNLQYSSKGIGMPACQHSSFPGELPVAQNTANLCSPEGAAAADVGGSAWEERNNSPYRDGMIGSYRVLDHREGSSSPYGSFSGSPRSTDFRSKRHSTSTSGVSSPRTPTHGAGGHRIGIDPRLVVGSPLEIAWEVLQGNPGVASLLNLQPSTAKLRNQPVQEDDEPEGPSDAAAAAGREPDTPLVAEQLVHEQGLVRSCRGLPARVRDDLIKAARLAVTRRDSSGRELPGTGLLPFFWRVQANLKWLLQQPATLKGQLLPGQIDFITEEQRGLSFQKTVQQRVRLGELAVLLHQMLYVPDEPGHTGGSS